MPFTLFPTAPASAPAPWHRALAQPALEFGPAPVKILSGQVPEGLRGRFYQNGTGRLQRGGEPVGHWFDGDGAILQLCFNRQDSGRSRVKATYRYVQTEGYRREQAAGRFLYANYGRRYPGPWWQSLGGLLTGSAIKNSANTSVLALDDRLLALWEAGNPHQLDPASLETVGKTNLGWLGNSQPFSAHPLRDPLSGEIYSIGVDALGRLHIYRCDRNCQLICQKTIGLKDVPLVHSFVLAGPYLVFLISPIQLNVWPLLLNQESYSDAISWRGDRGTRILIVERDRLDLVSEGRTDSWFQWHFGNGCLEADGTIRLDFVRFDEFGPIDALLRKIPAGQIATEAYGQLWQLRLDPQTGRVVSSECALDQDCEFPLVRSACVGQRWRYTYLLMHRDGVRTGQDWFGAVGRFDYDTANLLKRELPAGCYGTEPLPVPDCLNPAQGWLIETMYNSVSQRSEVWILSDQTLEPVCHLALPATIPLGFHGTWQSA